MTLSSAVNISTKVAERELLTSAVVHLEGDESVTVEIDSLRFIFTFKSDEGSPRYTGTIKDGALVLELFNHKNSLGEGMLTPVAVGTLSGRPLSFTYFANTINADKSARRFEYAFYLGDAK